MFQAFQENASALDKPPPNTCWVIPGRLLDGEYPGHPNEALAWDKLCPLMEGSKSLRMTATFERGTSRA